MGIAQSIYHYIYRGEFLESLCLACSAIPSSIVKPRSASRSWRRRLLDGMASAAAEVVVGAVTR